MDSFAHFLPGILLAYGFVALNLLSPGPNIFAVMSTSMSFGRRHGQSLAWGISAGSLLWATLTWMGLVVVVTAYASVLFAIKITGAL